MRSIRPDECGEMADPVRRFAAGALLLLLVAGAPAAECADHGDGRLSFDVVAPLAEGPPYAAAPVELAVALREPGAAPVPAGEIHLTLLDASAEASGDPIGLTGLAVDNGDPFAEPGDAVSLDVHFVPGDAPLDDLPTVTLFVWSQRPDPGGPTGSSLEFTSGPPPVLDVELFFDDYDAKVLEVSTQALLATVHLSASFEIADGQDLAFENVAVTGPDASGELRYSGTLRRVGPAFDPDAPLYRITLTQAPLAGVPALPLAGVVLAAALLLAAALWFGRRSSRRAAPPCQTSVSR